jgi:hypothetical protein
MEKTPSEDLYVVTKLYSGFKAMNDKMSGAYSTSEEGKVFRKPLSGCCENISEP